MKKKVLILMILFLVCFSTTTKALTTEERAGVDRGGLHSYIQWFEDYSGVLIVATTHVNDSGVMAADITVTAACVNSSRNFRLRIYDSDVKEFIEVDNEDGIGVKNRNFQVRVHMDSNILLWTAFVTDLSREVVYAQILLLYIYDEDAAYVPPGEEDEDTISQEEHEKAVKIASRNTGLSYLAITFVTIIITGAVVIQRKGTGVKHFIKSKIKSEGD